MSRLLSVRHRAHASYFYLVMPRLFGFKLCSKCSTSFISSSNDPLMVRVVSTNTFYCSSNCVSTAASWASRKSILGWTKAFKSRLSHDRSTKSLSNSGIAKPLNQRLADSWLIGRVGARLLNSFAKKAAEGTSG